MNFNMELCELVPQCTTVLRAHIWHSGIIYSQSATHIRNSQIMYYCHGNRRHTPVPGVIQHIYEVDGSMAFAVRRWCQLVNDRTDIFSAYPYFLAKVYSTCLAEKLEHIEVSWVLSHYACWAISDEDVVVLSLCRVRTFWDSAIDASGNVCFC